MQENEAETVQKRSRNGQKSRVFPPENLPKTANAARPVHKCNKRLSFPSSRCAGDGFQAPSPTPRCYGREGAAVFPTRAGRGFENTVSTSGVPSPHPRASYPATRTRMQRMIVVSFICIGWRKVSSTFAHATLLWPRRGVRFPDPRRSGIRVLGGAVRGAFWALEIGITSRPLGQTQHVMA